MQKKSKVKISRRFIAKAVVTFTLCVVVGAASFATALANTVSTIVTDGEKIYTFSMESTDINDIIKKAEEMGLTPLGANDVCERVGNTTAVNVRRGASVIVKENGAVTEFIAYKGDTVEKTLTDNSIILKEKDEITPAKDSVITSDLTVEIKRYCTVSVYADGQSKTVSLVGATVEDAIKEAGLTVGEEDTVSYPLDKALFDNMRIKIGRVVNVSVTVDGETKPYKVSAENVEKALQKSGVTLGENDIVSPPKNQQVTDGMLITVQRVEIKEETVKQEIDFTSKEENDSSIYPEDGYTKQKGEKGEKELLMKKYFIDGNFDREEVISEKTVKEPVDQIKVAGTKARPVATPPPSNNNSNSGNNESSDGIPAHSRVITGKASAYSDVGTTASGMYTERGLVAVDPSVIPYGTRLYIETSGGYSGYYTAADTGGALLSGRILIDIWMGSDQECFNFGIQSVTVYVLD